MKSIVALAILTLSVVAQASPTAESLGFSSETEMNNYFTIKNVKVTPVALPPSSGYDAPVPPAIALGNGLLETLGPVLMNPGNPTSWIAFGKKVWEVVVENKPVVNVQTQSVTVLPNNKKLWSQMSGWRGPRGAAYVIQAVNGFGTTVIDTKYTVTYNYGGKLNGKGDYIANATIVPSLVSVGWGYTYNSSVSVGDIVNVGSVDSPIPGVDLQLHWNMKTIIKETDGVDSFFATGNGSLQHISQ